MPYRFNSLLPFANAIPVAPQAPLMDIGAALRDKFQVEEAARANRARETETSRSNLARETHDTAQLGETTRSNRATEAGALRDDQGAALEVARDRFRRGDVGMARAVLEHYGLDPDVYLGPAGQAAPPTASAGGGAALSLNDDPNVQQQYRELGPSDMVISPREAGLDGGASAPTDMTISPEEAGLGPQRPMTGGIPLRGGLTLPTTQVEPSSLPDDSSRPASPLPDLSDFGVPPLPGSEGAPEPPSPGPGGASAPLSMRTAGIPNARPLLDPAMANQAEDEAVAATFDAFVQNAPPQNQEIARHIGSQIPALMHLARTSGKDADWVYDRLIDQYNKATGQASSERRAGMVAPFRAAAAARGASSQGRLDDQFLNTLKKQVVDRTWRKHGVPQLQQSIGGIDAALGLLKQAKANPLAGRLAIMEEVKSVAGSRFSDTDLRTIMTAGGKSQAIGQWFNDWTAGGEITDEMIDMLVGVLSQNRLHKRRMLLSAAKQVEANVRNNRQIRKYAGADLDSVAEELSEATLYGDGSAPIQEEPPPQAEDEWETVTP